MTPDELQRILQDGVNLNESTYILIILVCALAGFVGSYLSSYMKEKGKNYATKEDLSELKQQTKELTTATELVKAEISDKNLKSTRQWELKFEIYTEVLKSLAEWRVSIRKISDKLYNDSATHRGQMDRKDQDTFKQIDLVFSNFAKTEALAEIVFSTEQSMKIRNIRKTATTGLEFVSGKGAFEQAIKQIQDLEIELAREAKRELFS